MNTGFYKDLETNFEQAYILCNKEFRHEELLEMLKSGNIPQKQIAALKFDDIYNVEDAKILVSNLTGCDGKIREAVAMKFYQFVSKSSEVRNIFAQLDPKIFANATIDINANICRLVIDAIFYLKNEKSFINDYLNYILSYTVQALDEIDKFIFRDKKYVINKQIFKLYWCLESLMKLYDLVDEDKLYDILLRSAKQKEYTIRENVAKIVVLTNKFNDIKTILEKDENYYVKVALLNH